MNLLIKIAIALSIFAWLSGDSVDWIAENLQEIHSGVKAVVDPIHDFIVEKFNAFTSGNGGQQG